MVRMILASSICTLLVACATDSFYDPLEEYEQIDATGVLDAPTPDRVAPENQAAVSRGEYLVELLGCGSCHTDGALIGQPDMRRALAGSRIGIAYTSPFENPNPGIVFPPNITPDNETGIGLWSDQQIADAVRAGVGRHAGRRIMVMPWQAYARISEEDAWSIVGYLKSLAPVRHRVPQDVAPGSQTSEDYVHFGIYRSRDM